MQLVGIARLAALSPTLEAKRSVTYLELPTRNWINRCSSARVPFPWTINPYRGCEFACRYCYARYTHEFMELTPEDFERRIYAKQFQPAAFRSELARIAPPEHIAIGTATDPYQPAERRYRLTRRMLEVLAGERGRRLSVTTKSDLVARDADLLARIARTNLLNVSITVTTVDRDLARLVEPRAPRPDLRFRAMRELAGRGIAVGLSASPVLPGLTDSIENLRALASAAREAGARTLWANVVFLKPCARRVFFPFLERHFPHLAAGYRRRFAKADYLNGAYPQRIRDQVQAIRREFRLDHRFFEDAPEQSAGAQLQLFA